MKRVWFTLPVLLGGCLLAQNAGTSAEVKGDAVVVTINGKAYTADQVRAIVDGTPMPQAKALFDRDPKQFLQEHAYLMTLLDYAEKNGYATQSPYKETIEFYRMFVLSNAALTEKMRSIVVSTEEQKAYYDQHPNEFREARVRMIYIPFSDEASEAAAKKKADSVVKRARGGEDFVKLAKENSEDSTGAGGDFAVRHNSNQPPDHMKKVLLGAFPGTTTDPLRHENGYYIFRIEKSGIIPFEQVQNDIFSNIQNVRFRAWQEQLRSGMTVKFENDAFFQRGGAAKPGAVPAPAKKP